MTVRRGEVPVADAVVDLSTDFGSLSDASVTTDASGQATFTLTNDAGTAGTGNVQGGVITIALGKLTIDTDNGTAIDGDLDDDGQSDVEIRYASDTVRSGGGSLVIESSFVGQTGCQRCICVI